MGPGKSRVHLQKILRIDLSPVPRVISTRRGQPLLGRLSLIFVSALA
jgi:hypothetical protein